MKLFPAKMKRKQKKKHRKNNTYEDMGIYPVSFNKQRSTKFLYPKRGDLVKNKSGLIGKFVGIDPNGKVWIAYEVYTVQFPYKLQCEIFDLCFKEKQA